MIEITALCDYKGRFGSKYFENPYRSGMDKDLLKDAFFSHGVKIEYYKMSDPYIIELMSGQYVIYTSQEDSNLAYKGFIEDVVLGLEISGAILMPDYKYLRANNNKVFMEMLRKTILPNKYQLSSKWYGVSEEILEYIDRFVFPVVIKSSAGAGSHGVCIARDKQELTNKVKEISRNRSRYYEIIDFARFIRHKGYVRDSLFRNKFIVQEYVPELHNDWKVIVYYDKYFVLRRLNRPHDFRASGSGLFSYDDVVNTTLLDSAKEIKELFDVPIISMDLAISNGRVVLIEFQFVYFGTSTLEMSPYYYSLDNSGWTQVHQKSIIEHEYAAAISKYLKSR